MTQQIINIGAAPNDGTGDAVRSSFDKCNLNFTELYQVSRPTGNAIEYQFNNTTTEPPSVGQIRFNQATQASTTKLWASHTTSSGVNIKQFLAAATTGAKLVLQDKIDNTNYIKFDVTGDPIDKTTYWEFAVAVTASGGNLPNAAILAAVTASVGASVTDVIPNCGRLDYVSATALSFKPYNGDRIKIAGALYAIPSAGIAGLSNSGLSASTLYYVYAYNSSGTITGEFSTTTHAVSTTAGGTEIKSGDNTRTLIGMIRTNASSQFQSDLTYRGVISWFNRRNLSLVGVPSPGTTTSSTTPTELSLAARAFFVTWGEEAIPVFMTGIAFNATVAIISGRIYLDSATPVLDQAAQGTSGSSYVVSMAASHNYSAVEGYHWFTPYGSTSAGTATFTVYCTATIRG